MNALETKIESLLFIETKPLTLKKLSTLTETDESAVKEAVQNLQKVYEQRDGGVTVVHEGKNVQLMTAARNSEFIADYLNTEETGELSRPSLETLTIIAYRGPVAKTEIELIRGVNCSLILRNLMIRGLVEEVGETEVGSPVYHVTLDLLRLLGVNKASELPGYEDLNSNIHLQELMEAQKNPDDFFQAAE